MSGKVQVTVVYTINVLDPEDYQATDMRGAARNLASWYADGSSSPAEDLSWTKADSITVTVVEDEV